jgi:hypothetical protein
LVFGRFVSRIPDGFSVLLLDNGSFGFSFGLLVCFGFSDFWFFGLSSDVWILVFGFSWMFWFFLRLFGFSVFLGCLVLVFPDLESLVF